MKLEQVKKNVKRLVQFVPFLGDIEVREIEGGDGSEYEIVVPVRTAHYAVRKKDTVCKGATITYEPMAIITRARVITRVGPGILSLRRKRERVVEKDCWEVTMYVPTRGTREEPPDVAEVSVGITERDDLFEAVLLYERAIHSEIISNLREEASYVEAAEAAEKDWS